MHILRPAHHQLILELRDPRLQLGEPELGGLEAPSQLLHPMPRFLRLCRRKKKAVAPNDKTQKTPW